LCQSFCLNLSLFLGKTSRPKLFSVSQRSSLNLSIIFKNIEIFVKNVKLFFADQQILTEPSTIVLIIR